MNVNEWKNKLKDKVENGDSLPAPGMSWDSLEAGMASIERRRVVWKWTGVATAIAAAIAGIALVLPWAGPQSIETAPGIAEADSPKTEIIEIVKDIPAASNLLAVADIRPTKRASHTNPAAVVAEDNVSNDIVHDENIDEEDVKAEQTEETHRTESEVYNENALWPELEQEESIKVKRGRLSFGLGSGFATASDGDLHFGEHSYYDPIAGVCFTDPSTPSTPKRSYKLDFPVSFGVSAKYTFNNGLFLIGGISATTCHCVIFDEFNGGQLWYLGPSAGVGVNFYQNANFSAYTAATGQLDWCVSHYYMPILPSANLSAGVQFRLGSISWLFAEPQLKYTFKSENSTTIVSFDKPFQFSVNLGLRFEL
ncbi:MAG: hypothetical protein GX664_04680 [Bacteroidales bacterium]|nr:hypothetical protein [Bacteroidales bacterium]